MEGLDSPRAGRAIAFDFPAGVPAAAAARVPRRIRQRLLEARNSLPSSVEEIESKLRDAHLRRQQFYEWLSSKARAKPRSSSWLAQAEDPGQRLEARLCAAKQKRLSLLAKAQVRLARLDEQRQVARTDLEMRFEKMREELCTRVESRVQQAEANRVRLLKARMQRSAAVQERKARSLLQRVVRDNKYRECVNSAIVRKRAAAEKKRMGLLEAGRRRARARVNQARHVAMSICHQRENERRRIKEQLEIRFQRAKKQRSEYLKHRRSHHSSWNISMSNNNADLLSRKLAGCWRQFVRLKKTTFTLCEAFEMLDFSENSAKTLPFEHFADRIESASAIQTVRALLQRFETRLILSQQYSSSSPENIDHLLKHVITPKRRSPPGKAKRIRRPAKKALSKEFRSSEENKVSRYPVRVVLCAYMILGHPNSVFSMQGENELALRVSAENFVREFDLLIKITLDGPIRPHSVSQSFPDVLLDNCDHHRESTQLPKRHTFRSQLAAFDKAWSSYLYRFVAWKVKDATSLEEVLVRAACQLELSMMQTCKFTAEGQTCDLSNDMRSIKKQVIEDQALLRQKVLHLSGEAGIERLEIAISDTRSKYFEAKERGRPSISSVLRIPSPSTSSHSSEYMKDADKNQSVEDTGMPGHVIRSLFGAGSSNISAETQSVDTQSIFTASEQCPMENELIVNDIIHGDAATFTNNDINCENGNSIKEKIKETVEKAFWDGIMESLMEDKPDYNKIVKLVKEVRSELCNMSPQSWTQEILDSIDLDILSQVLESGMQDADYLGRILEYALVMLQRLSSSAEEDEMKKVHRKLLSELTCMAKPNAKQEFSFVLATVKGLRFVLNEIQRLKKEINRARIQLVEPIIRGSAGLEYLQKAFTNHYGPPSSAANSLPLTVQWISSLQTCWEEEWNEHVDSLSVLSTNIGLPLVATLRTGGSIPLATKDISPIVTSGNDGQLECKGEKVDVLVRLGLLKLASGIDGLTVDTVPETVKLNALRLRAIQSQLQNIIVISTSMLVFRQILISENIAHSPPDLENIVSESFRRLSELLDQSSDVGIQEIVEAVVGSSSDSNLQGRKEAMLRLLLKSLQKDDTVFMTVSKSIYLAMRGVVLGGSGVHGRKLSDAALRRVGAGVLLNQVVKTAEGLIVMANVSANVHGPWYRCLSL